ncbi:MAG: hypothetical protein ACR2L1_03520 [Pyrinomonadaceae bacterium]
MLEIKDTNKFGKVTADALAKVELTVKDAQTKTRWINAIAKAIVEIEENGAFMSYDETDNYLVIWSQKSNEVYSSNGTCQCKAFGRGYACWHRAAARLVRLYLELPENVAPKFPASTNQVVEITYLPNTKQPVRVEKYGSVRLPVYN